MDNPKQNDDNETLYVYEDLEGKDKIRVVHLHRADDVIECSIRQVSWSEGGYQALSYVWGSADRSYRAIVRDQDSLSLGYIPLTPNRKNALHDLYNTKEVTSKVFWIDQICINQEGPKPGTSLNLILLLPWIGKLKRVLNIMVAVNHYSGSGIKLHGGWEGILI
jgi:heterokaryon incompatibility protein (HET)